MNVFLALATVTLLQCHEAALKNYPLVKQAGLIEKTEEYSVDNAYRGYYPQVTVTAQATYQSAVTEVPIKIPQFQFEALSLDQYRAQVEITQTIWDGNAMGSQSDQARAQAQIARKQLDVELYRLKERVNQLFFGIQMVDEQYEQIRLLRADLQAALTSVSAAVSAGAAQKRDQYLLEAELLNLDQRETKLRAAAISYAAVLARLTGIDLDTSTTYMLEGGSALQDNIERPELRLFAAQAGFVDARTDAITARYLPKFSAFFNGGYGRPGLDMLLNEFQPYYITGVRMVWPLTDLWASSNERDLLDVNHAEIGVQRETFLFNTGLTMTQQKADLAVYDDLLSTDAKIIDKRSVVSAIAREQLANGTITAHDYLRDMNALDIARRERTLHAIQRQMTIEAYRITTGH
jgi:outer membrane protein TolC